MALGVRTKERTPCPAFPARVASAMPFGPDDCMYKCTTMTLPYMCTSMLPTCAGHAARQQQRLGGQRQPADRGRQQGAPALGRAWCGALHGEVEQGPPRVEGHALGVGSIGQAAQLARGGRRRGGAERGAPGARRGGRRASTVDVATPAASTSAALAAPPGGRVSVRKVMPATSIAAPELVRCRLAGEIKCCGAVPALRPAGGALHERPAQHLRLAARHDHQAGKAAQRGEHDQEMGGQPVDLPTFTSQACQLHPDCLISLT